MPDQHPIWELLQSPQSPHNPLPGKQKGRLASSKGITRRTLLKTGATGSLLLSTGAWLSGCSSDPAAPGLRFLTAKEEALMRALVPAVHTTLPSNPNQRQQAITDAVKIIDLLCVKLSAPVQDEIHQAFGLLTMSVTRYLIAGLSSDWPEATTEAVQESLLGLKNSSIGLFRQLYSVLLALTVSGWYGHPASWEALGYPGPPVINPPQAQHSTPEAQA